MRLVFEIEFDLILDFIQSQYKLTIRNQCTIKRGFSNNLWFEIPHTATKVLKSALAPQQKRVVS